MHDLKPTSPLRRLPAHGAHFDERDSLYVHGEIQRLLTRWDGARIDRIANQNYSSYRYFGVSALGEAPTGEATETRSLPAAFALTESQTRSCGCSRTTASSR